MPICKMEMTIILVVLTAWGCCPNWMRQRGNTWHTPSMPGKAHPSGEKDMTVSALPRSLSGCGCVHIHLEEDRSERQPSTDQHNYDPAAAHQAVCNHPFYAAAEGTETQRQPDFLKATQPVTTALGRAEPQTSACSLVSHPLCIFLYTGGQ